MLKNQKNLVKHQIFAPSVPTVRPSKLIPKSIICPLPFSWHPTTIRPWASDQNKDFPQGHRRAARKVTPAVTEAAAAATTAAAGTAVAAAAEL